MPSMIKTCLSIKFTILLLVFSSCGPQLSVDKPGNKSLTPFSLDELQRRSFYYFWDLADSVNFQILDRYPQKTFSSIAATGFGLTTYLIGVERGFVTRQQAAERVLKTLQFLMNLPQGDQPSGTAGYKGFFYHFLTLDKATRFKEVELSTIDTAWLMAGILSCMTYFDAADETETNIRQLADALYRRVEWDWIQNDSTRIAMGWYPEKGFHTHDWKGYNEAMALIILAIGSPTHPVPPEAWQQWCSTYEWQTYYDQPHVNFGPLFGHQYSQMYIDFKGIQDEYMREKGLDYFENAKRGTIANRAYCLDNPKNFTGYGENLWGLTACDGPANEQRQINGNTIRFQTYSARGAAYDYVVDDGTIAPTAAGGSLPFLPQECTTTLQYMWETYYEDLVGEYGLKDAFNLTYTFGQEAGQGWFDTDYLGIDQGPIVIQIENLRNGFVWNLMKKNPYIVEGLRKAGFKGGWLNTF